MQIHQQQSPGIFVIYASQTGTSYDLAKQFVLTYSSTLPIRQFKCISQIISITQFQQKPNTIFLFFISTTGQGDLPYTMRNLWKGLLNKSHEKLEWMKFSIYSLGDRSYGDNFCMAARKFRQRLLGLGAYQIIQIGLGDQQQANGYFQQYKDKWLPNLMNYFIDKKILIPHVETKATLNFSASFSNKFKSQYDLKLLSRAQVCPNKDRRIFTVDIQLIDYPQDIMLGDILLIYPQNNPSDVQFLADYLSIGSQDFYSDQTSGNKISYLQLFATYLNLSSTLSHSFFIKRPDLPPLSSYCQSQLFKSKLIQLQSDYEQYHNYIKKYKRNVVQVIKDFQLKIPKQEFVKRCEGIIARKYSIAGKVDETHYNPIRNLGQALTENIKERKIVKILFKLVNKEINANRTYKGVCSHDLALWSSENDIRKGSIIKGEFMYEEKSVNNVVMMTLGTGIAPFLQYFDQAKNSKNQWNIQLFFTNRHLNQIYFQPQLQQLSFRGKMNPFLSFTGAGGKRITRLVEDNIKALQKFIEIRGIQNISILICGPKKMFQGDNSESISSFQRKGKYGFIRIGDIIKDLAVFIDQSLQY